MEHADIVLPQVVHTVWRKNYTKRDSIEAANEAHAEPFAGTSSTLKICL